MVPLHSPASVLFLDSVKGVGALPQRFNLLGFAHNKLRQLGSQNRIVDNSKSDSNKLG